MALSNNEPEIVLALLCRSLSPQLRGSAASLLGQWEGPASSPGKSLTKAYPKVGAPGAPSLWLCQWQRLPGHWPFLALGLCSLNEEGSPASSWLALRCG